MEVSPSRWWSHVHTRLLIDSQIIAVGAAMVEYPELKFQYLDVAYDDKVSFERHLKMIA